MEKFKASFLLVSNVAFTSLNSFIIVILLGANIESDLLFIGMTIPQLLINIISNSSQQIILPILNSKSEKKIGEIWFYIRLFSALFLGITIVLVTTTSIWIPLIAPGLSLVNISLLIKLTNIQILSIGFSSLVIIISSYYYSINNIVKLEKYTLYSNAIGLVLIYILFNYYSLYGIAIALTIKPIINTVLLIKGILPYQHVKISESTLLSFLEKVKNVIIGSIFYKTEPLLDRFFLSYAPPGVISVHTIIQKFYTTGASFLYKIYIVPVINKLSLNKINNDFISFNKLYKQALKRLLTINIMIYLIIVFFCSIIYFFVVNNNYPLLKIDNLNIYLIFLVVLGGYWIAGSVQQMLVSVFYNLGISNIPQRILVKGYIYGILIKILLFYLIGFIGIPLGASGYLIWNTITLYKKLNGKAEKIFYNN